MRSFIGIDFSREVKEDISKIQSKVRENAAKGRFKHVNNFHITLKFLGDITNEQASKIERLLQYIAGKHQAFELCLSSIECFKSKQGINTLYIGLGGNTKALSLLNSDVEAALETLGFKRENRLYTPHITIAQDLTLNIPFEKLKHEIDTKRIGKIEVNRIELIKSEQIQYKRIYTPICGFGLKSK